MSLDLEDNFNIQSDEESALDPSENKDHEICKKDMFKIRHKIINPLPGTKRLKWYLVSDQTRITTSHIDIFILFVWPKTSS